MQNFEKVWKKIESKFHQKNGQIFHKRVTKELRAAKKFLQNQQSSGLRGARKRWARYSDPNGKPISLANGLGIAKESKVKESKENQRKDIQQMMDVIVEQEN
ncbi:MAG: hypothetical protein WCZ89_08685 [Phycisphaerae bacterium]